MGMCSTAWTTWLLLSGWRHTARLPRKSLGKNKPEGPRWGDRCKSWFSKDKEVKLQPAMLCTGLYFPPLVYWSWWEDKVTLWKTDKDSAVTVGSTSPPDILHVTHAYFATLCISLPAVPADTSVIHLNVPQLSGDSSLWDICSDFSIKKVRSKSAAAAGALLGGDCANVICEQGKTNQLFWKSDHLRA